mmetsp:Transcript_69422/g.157525  ORF Transcript_69422/g.157525 Transcript_69422/m.157525 type:complete len:321 (+) Transcript_69422:997-1959(+)
METQQLGNLGTVGGVLMDAKLEALAKLLVELLVIILLLGNLSKHLQALLDQVLLDHTEDLVLLKCLTGDVQRKVLGVHNALDHVEPLWHELIAVIHDEDTAHVKLDVVPLLLRLEEVKGCPARHEEQRTELKLTLNAEVLHCQMVLPVIGERLVEGRILLVGDVLGLAHPQGLVLVELLPLMGHLLHLLRLFLLGLLLLLLINLLDLRLVTLLVLLFLLFLLILGVRDLLLLRLLNVQLNREADEFGVLLHQVLQPALLQELRLVLFQVADHLGAALDLAMHELSVLLHGEGAACAGLPDVLLIIVVLADHTDLVRDQVG